MCWTLVLWPRGRCHNFPLFALQRGTQKFKMGKTLYLFLLNKFKLKKFGQKKQAVKVGCIRDKWRSIWQLIQPGTQRIRAEKTKSVWISEKHIHKVNHQCLTAGGEADGPLVTARWQTHSQHHHRALGGPHQQTGAEQAVRLPGETLTEVKRGDGLSRLPVYAGYARTPRAAERVILDICAAGSRTKGTEWGNKLHQTHIITVRATFCKTEFSRAHCPPSLNRSGKTQSRTERRAFYIEMCSSEDAAVIEFFCNCTWQHPQCEKCSQIWTIRNKE